MLNWIPRRVRFVGAATESVQPTRRAVSVSLERQGEPYIGRAQDGSSLVDELRHAAEATLAALRQVVGGETQLGLTTVGPIVALGQNFVLAVVKVTHLGHTHTLLGVCPRTATAARDAALAVLGATNRVLGLS